MKLGRFSDGSSVFYGMVNNNRVTRIESLQSREAQGDRPLLGLTVLTPCVPSKIVAVGQNYKLHARELDLPVPEEPVLFLKPPTAALAHGAPVSYPSMAARVDYEAELAVVIGKGGRDIPEKAAKDHILGYTAFNDVTARDLQKKDGQWARAKGFDTFAPFGPYIRTDIPDPQNLRIQALLNGEILQDSNTSDMIFPITYIVSFVSRIMTLMPGDVIATGTPQGIGPMRRGDTVTIRIEGLDDLTNPVR